LRPDLHGEALHHHLFQEGGIAVAVQRLHSLITNAPPLIGLGYSAGGTALWQAVRAGARLSGLLCISSTRLRNEGTIPIPNAVVFGENDPGRPSKEWLATVPQHATLLPDADHAFYADGTHTALPDLRNKLSRHVANWRS
jgi:dienelactone hydrolase